MCFQEALQQEWEACGEKPGRGIQWERINRTGASTHEWKNKPFSPRKFGSSCDSEYLPRRRNMDVGFIEGLVSSSWTCVLGNDSA
eukprot:m.227590 g.227590  ORF g.227590 m.227590 type:complete len:85 (-) comp54244_c0_seq23:1702-1956(-)